MISTRQDSLREESESPSPDRPTAALTRCKSCGLSVVTPHGTDADCIAALHEAIDRRSAAVTIDSTGPRNAAYTDRH
jgi:hypothetical protein